METLTLRTFTKRITEDPAFARRVAASTSPGYVASRLGVTRQAVHDLLRRGVLQGLRVSNGRASDCMILVYEDSVAPRLRRSA